MKPLLGHAALTLLFCSLAGCGGDDVPLSEKIRKKQDELLEAVTAAGGTANLKNYPGWGEAWVVDLHGATVSAAIFDALKQLKRVSELNLSGSNVDDSYAPQINEIGNVTVNLNLSKTAFTDAGLEQLDSLFFLRDLNLTGTKVTSRAVSAFRKRRSENSKILPLFKNPSIKL